MKRISAVVLFVLVLVVAACGSRAEGPSGDDGALSEEGGSGGEGEAPSAEGAEVGTIDNPCSDTLPEGNLPADAVGVTEDSIRIGVISDRENPTVPLPTVGIEEAVRAFVEFCNEAGGINGRTLELKTYDSQIARVDDVTKQACADELFALVGSGSVLDQQGIETRVGCDLPEIAAYAATSERASSDLFFQPVPANTPGSFNVGPCKYIQEQFPDAVQKAAMVYTDIDAASTQGTEVISACEAEAGFEFAVEAGLAFGETNFGPIVSQIKSEGVEHFTMVSAVSETLAILREIQAQGVELEVIDLGQQYYDPAVAKDPAAEGALVLTNTVPFTEADETPALKLYQDYVGQVDGQETTLGVQAFSAGLLFATAAASLDNDLTRDALLEAVGGINSWDGGGLHMETNPGENEEVDCFLYLKVEGGEFKREFPEEGFECSPDFVAKL